MFFSDKPEMIEMDATSVTYINGEPDFTDYSIYVFEIDSMTDDRLPYSDLFRSNYEQAYKKLSEILHKDEVAVKKW